MEHHIKSDDSGDSNFEKPVRSIYIPPYGLQGQELSCHLTWDHEYLLDYAKIILGSGVTFKHIYNVDASEIESDTELEVKVSKVQENGYLGYVLQSQKLPETIRSVEVTVEAEFSKEDKKFASSKKFLIELFRPELEITKISPTIKIKLSDDGVTPEIKEGEIELLNKGKGIAYLFIFADESSPTDLSTYLDTDTSKLASSLKPRLMKLKEDYPEEEKTLDRLGEWFAKALDLESIEDTEFEQFMEEGNYIQGQLEKKERTNKDLVHDIGEVVFESFRSVVSSTKMFNELLRSIQGMMDQRIVLLNSMSAIAIDKKETKISFKLQYGDALNNEYAPLLTGVIKIENLSSAEFKLPIYQLFERKGGSSER